MLHVPKLTCNLLSVSKLSRDTNCHIIFCSTHCLFQDQGSGEMIGRASLLDGLYYFDESPTSDKKVQGLSCVSSPSVRETIMLWHVRLGHPSFSYLKFLFPKLFNGIDCSSFHCESCIFAKNHQATYLPKPYKVSKPFHLIHSDVWGPSKVLTHSDKSWFVTFIDDHTTWVYLFIKKKNMRLRTSLFAFITWLKINFKLN